MHSSMKSKRLNQINKRRTWAAAVPALTVAMFCMGTAYVIASDSITAAQGVAQSVTGPR